MALRTAPRTRSCSRTKALKEIHTHNSCPKNKVNINTSVSEFLEKVALKLPESMPNLFQISLELLNIFLCVPNPGPGWHAGWQAAHSCSERKQWPEMRCTHAQKHMGTWAHSVRTCARFGPCLGFVLARALPLAKLTSSHPLAHSLSFLGRHGGERHFGSPVLCGNFMLFAPCNFPGCRRPELSEFVHFIPLSGKLYILFLRLFNKCRATRSLMLSLAELFNLPPAACRPSGNFPYPYGTNGIDLE